MRHNAFANTAQKTNHSTLASHDILAPPPLPQHRRPASVQRYAVERGGSGGGGGEGEGEGGGRGGNCVYQSSLAGSTRPRPRAQVEFLKSQLATTSTMSNNCVELTFENFCNMYEFFDWQVGNVYGYSCGFSWTRRGTGRISQKSVCYLVAYVK